MTSSVPKTFRGLHYQYGDFAQTKYFSCIHGSVTDIAVDMRRSSDTFGQTFQLALDSSIPVGVIIPPGFAHGIYSATESIVINICDRPYRPDQEGGIYFSSIPELRGLDVVNLSTKDASLPKYKEVMQCK